MSEPSLAFLLLRGARWFDGHLLARLEEAGWPRLTAAQSLVFPHLGPDGVSVSDLARALGVTRQSAHELVGGLVRLDLVESLDDPTHRRRRRVVLTRRGRALAADARRILADLEEEVATTIDTAALARLLGQAPFASS